jgi:hypothetical protein
MNRVIRANIAVIAKADENSTEWLDYEDPPGTMHYGCNLFIKSVIDKAGAQAPVTTDWKQWLRFIFDRADSIYYPALAKDWATPQTTLTCWDWLRQGPDSSLPGDVIAQKISYSDVIGHAGFVVTTDPYQTASANSSVIPAGLITINDWGFRSDDAPSGQKENSVIKRYSCY